MTRFSAETVAELPGGGWGGYPGNIVRLSQLIRRREKIRLDRFHVIYARLVRNKTSECSKSRFVVFHVVTGCAYSAMKNAQTTNGNFEKNKIRNEKTVINPRLSIRSIKLSGAKVFGKRISARARRFRRNDKPPSNTLLRYSFFLSQRRAVFS